MLPIDFRPFIGLFAPFYKKIGAQLVGDDDIFPTWGLKLKGEENHLPSYLWRGYSMVVPWELNFSGANC